MENRSVFFFLIKKLAKASKKLAKARKKLAKS
jgi:hypothetical protein